ncbi:ABC transporter ATP-binding protein/permease [Bacillus sp. IITD106]|nr:ABC transporter ATP-binding protein/permease [Bacillus sp. IITD106]
MRLKNHYTLIDSIKIPYECARFWTVVRMLIVLVQRLEPTLQVLVTAMFINRAMLLLNGKETMSNLALPIILLGILLALSRVYDAVVLLINCKIENALRISFRNAIVHKRAKMQYTYIENPETWNLILRVSNEPEQHIMQGLSSVTGIAGIIITSIGILSILVFNVWWAAIAILIIMIPMVIIAIKSGTSQYELDRELTNTTRKYEYFSNLLISRESVNERSVFSFHKQLNPKWSILYETARVKFMEVFVQWTKRSKIGSVIMSLFVTLIALAILPPLATGEMTVGLYIALVQAAAGMVQLIASDLPDLIVQQAKYTEYCKDISAFAKLEDTDGALDLPAEKIPDFQTLEFINVVFKYPGTEKIVLNELSFKLIKGKHYALVGINGAGKSTIVKLILGLYNNYDGEILLNGKNITFLTQAERKSLVSVLFQDFAQYPLSFLENIAIADSLRIGDEDVAERVLAVSKQIGLQETIDDLPNGIFTHLGKIEKNGQDLSGGQWQRVAIARTILSPAPIHILDEPTSAADPIKESELYKEFEMISRGWTTIFISHRLGSTKLADEVLLINEGKVAEQGTHEELMQIGGIYCAMYESQRRWYQ